MTVLPVRSMPPGAAGVCANFAALSAKMASFFRNRPFLQLLGVIDLADELLAGLSQTIGFRLLLQQAACAGRADLLHLYSLLDQFGSPPRLQMSLLLRRFRQFLQAPGQDGIPWMVKAGQPHSLASDIHQANPHQVMLQLHTIVHPTQGHFRVI
jgi:hypothetical protein